MLVVTLLAVGVVSTGVAVLAMTGLWRSWTRTTPVAFVAAWFWLGLAAVCMGLAAAFIGTSVFGVAFVFAVAAAVTGGTGLWCGLLGAPRWMQPRWYRLRHERTAARRPRARR